jgi:hypothetical protein
MEMPIDREAAVSFSEGNQARRAIPSWAEFLIQLGYRWPSDSGEPRRIALISMPCDSAAAGLVALGALARDLQNRNANDVDGHHDSLLRYAHQYLDACRVCRTRCEPELCGCGYTSAVTGEIRRVNGKRYQVAEFSKDPDTGEQCIVVIGGVGRKQERRWMFRRYATDWHIEGQPEPQIKESQAELPRGPYNDIVGTKEIVTENLRRSFSGLCLAGRVSGESSTRDVCASVRFGCNGNVYQLPELLTVHGWSTVDRVSRTAFFNARTGKMDRQCNDAALVVADGHASFLKIVDMADFQRSDVIGVMHRTIERDDLESVGNHMLGLAQWYVEDSELLGRFPCVPRGLEVRILRRRTR